MYDDINTNKFQTKCTILKTSEQANSMGTYLHTKMAEQYFITFMQQIEDTI